MAKKNGTSVVNLGHGALIEAGKRASQIRKAFKVSDKTGSGIREAGKTAVKIKKILDN
jgi:hypothetical protein